MVDSFSSSGCTSSFYEVIIGMSLGTIPNTRLQWALHWLFLLFDQRRERLKEHIKVSLANSRTYEDFEYKMKELKYEVIRMRGIAFKDAQKVYTKGSEVGYSLGNIERILAQKQSLKPEQKMEPLKPKIGSQNPVQQLPKLERQQPAEKNNEFIQRMMANLTKESAEGINPELTQDEIKRRRKHRHRH